MPKYTMPEVEAVLDVLAPFSPGIQGVIPSMRVPLIFIEYLGGPVVPNDDQMLAIAREIVTKINAARPPLASRAD